MSNEQEGMKKVGADTLKVYSAPTLGNTNSSSIDIQRPQTTNQYERLDPMINQNANAHVSSNAHAHVSRPGKTFMKRTNHSPRINPDSLRTLWFTVGLIIVLGITSFLVSFNGLLDVAAWVGLPHSLRWTVPGFIDVSILAYSMAAVIHKARGERVTATWVSLAVFTLISVVANAIPVISKGEGTTMPQIVIGATIAAAAPIAVFAATEELSCLAFRAPTHPPEQTTSIIEDEQTTALKHDNTNAPQLPLAPAEESSHTKQEINTSEETAQSTPTVTESPLTVPATEEPTLSVPLEENETSSAAVTDESAEVQNETPQKPTQADLDAEMQGLATWVKEQHGAGHKVTGASVAEYIGKSPRTGSNRLNQLKEAMPELFEGEQ